MNTYTQQYLVWQRTLSHHKQGVRPYPNSRFGEQGVAAGCTDGHCAWNEEQYGYGMADGEVFVYACT